MPIPLERHDVRQFAEGLDEVLVIEEKNPTLELLVRDALYDVADRPRVWGKRDEHGKVLVPYDSLLDAVRLMPALRHHLGKRLGDRLVPEQPKPERQLIPLSVNRAPYFCSGCPHNTSTRVEPGTFVGGGIGCHAMVAFMEPERTGDLVGLTCMGSEGAQWIGMSPFVERKHLVQNLGDGTFFHSGSLAIRASIAAGIDITYKLLHNGTVAMTGGQDAQGAVDVPRIATMLIAEGAKRIIITTDDTERLAGATLPQRRRRVGPQPDRRGAARAGRRQGHHDPDPRPGLRRREASRPQPGHDRDTGLPGRHQRADLRGLRRLRRQVELPVGAADRHPVRSQDGDPPDQLQLRLLVHPGRLPGVRHGHRRPGRQARSDRNTPSAPEPGTLIAPTPAVDPDNFTVRLSGIGGTGVITVSQLIGTAALLDGFHVRGLDQTGLSQKAGPVTSDVRVTRDEPASSNHAKAAGVDCFLAFDLLAAASDAHLEGAVPGRTVVIGSVDVVPTGDMVVHPDSRTYPELMSLRSRLDEVSRPDTNRYLDAGAITRGLFGGTTTSNVLTMGVAVQIGAIPIDPASLERAIEFNGVAVDLNIAAFRFGRRWALDPDAVEAAAGFRAPRIESLDQMIERLSADLADYQNDAYARRFRRLVDSVRATERSIAPDSTTLTDAVARHFHKLMAYKDEYEVARLALLDESQLGYQAVGGPDTKVTYHLHPPMLRSIGIGSKIKFRRTGDPSFTALRAIKRLRGTKADPFGWAAVRRVERAMMPEYEQAITTVLAQLTVSNLDEAVEIASLPDQVRGYEHIKLARAEAYRAELAQLLARFSPS